MKKSTSPQTFLGRTLVCFALLTIILTCQLCRASAPSAAPVESGVLSGTVLETMNASGYTYFQVDSGQQKSWVAIPETTIIKGEKVQYQAGMTMENFHSKTLNRTFSTIVFSPGLTDSPEPASKKPGTSSSPDQSFSAAVQAEASAKTTPEIDMTPSGGSTGAVAPFTEAKVEKAPGEHSYTVAEIFAKAKELNGTTVRLRAKIVKLNSNIMGRNWLHLQDGSGDPMSNTHDLVVTTTEAPIRDQVVTIEGKMTANKDFGSGYSYVAIIEDAKIIP